MKDAFLHTLRELTSCYQAFETYSAAHVRELGLTPAQFDIVATLGNTTGMTFRELGEKTLITKGTLTGVVDRLEARRLVVRKPSPDDARSTIVRLTAAGDRLFSKIFPLHLEHLKNVLGSVSENELRQCDAVLARLRERFEAQAQ